MNLHNLTKPLAITMWDFSWLERRWPGAGYEDPDQILDELVERGYNAIRLDAYPHLVAKDAEREWTIRPCWNQQDWGSPAKNRVAVQPQLNAFIRKCAERGILLGLSTWFQRVEEMDWSCILSAKHHAEIWKRTLDSIAADGLLDSILFVDFCNEWPLRCWAPFFESGPEGTADPKWVEPDSLQWISESVEEFRRSYPDISVTYSHTGGALGFSEAQVGTIRASIDFLEPHLWMVHARESEFYQRVGYEYERFDPKGYEKIVEHAENLYAADPAYWKMLLEEHIDASVQEAEMLGLPMITTECWGIVDYKDWPLLNWDWVKEICAHGVRYAAGTGRWCALSTSNFCGPQFAGMWRDKDWHRELTGVIKSSLLPSQGNYQA